MNGFKVLPGCSNLFQSKEPASEMFAGCLFSEGMPVIENAIANKAASIAATVPAYVSLFAASRCEKNPAG